MGYHVLQLGPVPPPEGGISRNILAIRSELRRRGHRCSIIATSKSTKPAPETDVHHPRSPAAFASLIARGRYDLIHVHIGGEVNKRTLGVALAATAVAGRRTVFTLHSGGFPSSAAGKKAKHRSLPGAVFRRFGAIIALNNELADVFARFGVEPGRLRRILPFSVEPPDPDVSVPAELDRFAADHAPFLVSVGGLEAEYDPMFQIAAMTRIREEFPNAGLMLVGDGSMRRSVAEAIAASPHGGDILLAGNVAHAVTLHLIARAAALLRTTRFDGDAISVREALHLGTPAIATDNGMRPEGTRLIRSGSHDDLVDQIRGAVRTGRGPAGDTATDNIRAVADLYDDVLQDRG